MVTSDLLLQPHGNAAEGASRPDRADKAIHPALHLGPDFLRGGGDMGAAVGELSN